MTYIHSYNNQTAPEVIMSTKDFAKGIEYAYDFTVPGLPDLGTLTEVGVLDEIAEDWVSFRPYGSDNLFVFGQHPEAIAPLSSLRLAKGQ